VRPLPIPIRLSSTYRGISEIVLVYFQNGGIYEPSSHITSYLPLRAGKGGRHEIEVEIPGNHRNISNGLLMYIQC